MYLGPFYLAENKIITRVALYLFATHKLIWYEVYKEEVLECSSIKEAYQQVSMLIDYESSK